MSGKVTRGAIVPVKLNADAVPAFEASISSYIDIVKNEPGTVQWFLTKSETNDLDYAFFDTWVDEDAMKAHVEGAMVSDLKSKEGEWWDRPPVHLLHILASKIGPPSYDSIKGGVEVGLQATIKAKEDKVEEVRQFLIDALPLAEEESFTPHWLAFHVPDTNVFGIVDLFPSPEDRQAHLEGKIAAALTARADELLAEPFEINLFTVVAGNIN